MAAAVIDVRHLPNLVSGSRAPVWWGIVLLLTIEATVFGTIIASYYYLRMGEPQWPPAGVPDPELLLRHEVQDQPPDLLITNYSMLEYMLLRPIERSIFERTRAFFEANAHERLLFVLDEAHLYRGASGTEARSKPFSRRRRIRSVAGAPSEMPTT